MRYACVSVCMRLDMVNEAPLHTPGKRTALCSGEGSWGMHSTLFISFGVPFLIPCTPVQNPTRTDHPFCMPFLVSGMLSHQNLFSYQVLLSVFSLSGPVCCQPQLLVPIQSGCLYYIYAGRWIDIHDQAIAAGGSNSYILSDIGEASCLRSRFLCEDSKVD